MTVKSSVLLIWFTIPSTTILSCLRRVTICQSHSICRSHSDLSKRGSNLSIKTCVQYVCSRIARVCITRPQALDSRSSLDRLPIYSTYGFLIRSLSTLTVCNTHFEATYKSAWNACQYSVVNILILISHTHTHTVLHSCCFVCV